jgi:hypothetical protein
MSTLIAFEHPDEATPVEVLSGWDRADADEWAVTSGPITRFFDRLAQRRSVRRR